MIKCVFTKNYTMLQKWKFFELINIWKNNYNRPVLKNKMQSWIIELLWNRLWKKLDQSENVNKLTSLGYQLMQWWVQISSKIFLSSCMIYTRCGRSRNPLISPSDLLIPFIGWFKNRIIILTQEWCTEQTFGEIATWIESVITVDSRQR